MDNKIVLLKDLNVNSIFKFQNLGFNFRVAKHRSDGLTLFTCLEFPGFYLLTGSTTDAIYIRG